MNIIEAIKSGKRFRRAGDASRWFGPGEGRVSFWHVESVLATDWEVEEERRELTWKEVWKAVVETGMAHYYSPDAAISMESRLKHVLGFKG